MLLMLDNYDSFTYNVVQYLGELGADVRVVRNDELSVAEIEALNPERIVVSPGPCTPNEAGVSLELIRHFAGKLPILGVCLGHQSIGQAFGGDVVRARQVMHGKTSPVYHHDQGAFRAEQPTHGDALPLAGGQARNAAGLPGSDGLDAARRRNP